MRDWSADERNENADGLGLISRCQRAAKPEFDTQWPCSNITDDERDGAKTMRIYIFASLVLILTLQCGFSVSAESTGGNCNWTGSYAGLNIGAAVNASQYTLRPTGSFLMAPFASNNSLRTDSADLGGATFTGGGQLGYNYQAGRFILGLETDFNYNGIDQSQYVNRVLEPPLSKSFIHTVTQNVDFYSTFRGRLGYTPMDRMMVYATGGPAWGETSTNSNALFTQGGDHYTGSSSGLQAGWTLGAGGEYALDKHWSLKLEYLYVDLGSRTYTYGNQTFPGFTYTTQLDTSQHVVRLGINYKF
jgi:outer membrane immunogenic protein